MTTRRYVMGIDPGFSGAMAVHGMVAHGGVWVRDMPLKADPDKRQAIDLSKLAEMFRSWAPLQISHCFIEEPSAMPGQGVTSMFRFGHACGAVQAMAYAFEIPNIVLVRPAVWKSAMGLSSDKNASREKATKLFPAHADLWKLKKHDGRAEALLLAVFGARYI